MINPISKQRRQAELAFAKVQLAPPLVNRATEEVSTATSDRAAKTARLRAQRLARDHGEKLL